MKTIKSILIAATLICATVVSTMSAQQAAQPAQQHQFKVALGDSVMIKRECQKYSTGETPSVWVWDKVHTVRQLGTKKYPDGVLLMSIYSWICEDCLIPAGQQKQEQAQPAQGGETTPAQGGETTPAQGGETTPAQGGETTPAQGGETTPAQGGETTPVQGGEVTPAQGGETTPAQGGETVEEETPEQRAARLAAERRAAEEAAIQAADSAARAQQQQQQQGDGELQQQGDTMVANPHFKHPYDRFTIGIRGGAAGLLHNVVDGNWTCGGDVLLDLQYAHYWAKEGRPVDLGIIVGLAIGYSQSGMKTVVNTDTTYNTSDGDIQYKLRADEVKENDGQIQLEIPLMFSLIHDNGLFFNIGPKFMLPVYTPYNQNLKNPNVNAYFVTEGVTVSNEVITGLVTDQQMKQSGADNGNQFSINVMLTAELGYEWTLKSGNSFGLGAYANYCVYNSFSNNAANKPLMDITPPQGSSVASVDVLSATKTYAKGLGYFDAGIKLAYHFNFPKKQYMKFRSSKL